MGDRWGTIQKRDRAGGAGQWRGAGLVARLAGAAVRFVRWWRLSRSRRVEWRAQAIRDPKERLRYLRAAMGTVSLGNEDAPARFTRWRAGAVGIAVLAAGVLLAPAWESRSVEAVGLDREIPLEDAGAGEDRGPGKVWLVEEKDGHEVFSNGLRVETAYAVSNEPRRVMQFEEGGRMVVAGSARPRGIVFHTTESHIAPFEESENQRLRRVGKWLLEFVRDQRAYHYLIDRFGRVHRVVKEDDAAWHAGHSLWADREQTYAYLNHSFLGVAFESVTNPGGEIGAVVTPAQIHAARTLTEMLRGRYRIAAVNCVTHAQVSVNPASFLIGAHTDWAAGFPFSEMGLPDNYERPLAALYAYGFGYDDEFVRATGARMWKGLALSEDQVRQEATARGIPVRNRRDQLRQQYRSILARIDGAAPAPAGAHSRGEAVHSLKRTATRTAGEKRTEEVRE
ncbi:MAG: peptidoglycan recognition family protein [Bryobacteraceae bacterium]